MIQQSKLENRLLSRLPAAEFARLADRLEPIDCPLGMVLVAPDMLMSHAYFLETGVASIVVFSTEGRMAEGGLVGREGFVAAAAILGSNTTPHKIEMQMAGAATRITLAALTEKAAEGTALRNALLRFAHVTIVQMTYSVLANAVQTVNERLARWLLMCLDRCDSTDLALTHRFIAVMLSVRRSTVTDSLHLLEGYGFLTNDRGYITIRDRAGLENYAGEAYGKPEDEYRRLLGPF